MVIDTNILIYSTRPSSSFHARAVAALARAGAELRLTISRQVMREYLAVVTRPGGGSEPLAMAEAPADVARFADAFDVLEDGPAVGAQLVELCRSVALGGRQVRDANIVATMLAHEERRLLTANRSDFEPSQPRIALVVL